MLIFIWTTKTWLSLPEPEKGYGLLFNAKKDCKGLKGGMKEFTNTAQSHYSTRHSYLTHTIIESQYFLFITFKYKSTILLLFGAHTENVESKSIEFVTFVYHNELYVTNVVKTKQRTCSAL